MKYSLLLFFCFCAHIMVAQTNQPAIAKIHYDCKHVNDTTNRDKFMRDETVLYLNQQASYYTSYSPIRLQEETTKQINNPNFDGSIVINKRSTPITSSYLLDLSENKLTEQTNVASDKFSIPANYPVQEWEIIGDTKEIGGYKCQNAKTTFKGRMYEVWFTTELPFPFGPWKLHGLPGLILDARDSKNEVIFAYAGFDKLENTSTKVALPQNTIPTTTQELKKMLEAFKANPQAYISARSSNTKHSLSSTSTTIVIGSDGKSSSSQNLETSRIKSVSVNADEKYKPSKVMNNPIELTP